MNKTVNEKIAKVIEHYELNVNSFSRKVGKSSPTIRNIVDGRSKPGYDVIEAILTSFPELNSDYFFRDDPEMFKQEKPVAQVVPDRKLLETLYYTIDLQRQKLRELGKQFDVSIRQFSFSLSM